MAAAEASATGEVSTIDRLTQQFRLAAEKKEREVEEMGDSRTEKLRQSLTFQNMIRAAVTLGVGVLVTAEVFNALPNSSGPIGNASDNVEQTTGDSFELAPVVLIVIVAGLILGAVRGF